MLPLFDISVHVYVLLSVSLKNLTNSHRELFLHSGFIPLFLLIDTIRVQYASEVGRMHELQKLEEALNLLGDVHDTVIAIDIPLGDGRGIWFRHLTIKRVVTAPRMRTFVPAQETENCGINKLGQYGTLIQTVHAFSQGEIPFTICHPIPLSSEVIHGNCL